MNVGDKVSLDFGIRGWDAYSVGDRVYIAVKPTAAGSVSDYLLTVKDTDGVLVCNWSVSSVDTKDWETGSYTYELRVEHADGINRDILQQGGTITVRPVIK